MTSNPRFSAGHLIALALCWGAMGYFVGFVCQAATAEEALGPRPGDVYREYRWTNRGGDAGGSLRVGGKFDYGGGLLTLPHDVDLDLATRAEIVLEKLLCHDGTRGLEIAVNDQDWIAVPEATGIPEPQWEYQHHIYPIVTVPLSHLKPGPGANQIRLRVSDQHSWNWPQNLLYGIHVRVYYDAKEKPHPAGRLISPQPGGALGQRVPLAVEASSPNGPIRRVDYVGHYEDVNFEGDGRYLQWHYHYVKAELLTSLGAATEAPWQVTWDATWVPDQPQPFQLAAIVTDETGLSCFTEPVGQLTFHRPGVSVELCKPYEVPTRWVTRRGEKSEKFRVLGDLSRATAAQLLWVSWSPGYLHGILVNGQQVFQREGPRYDYFAHRVTLDDLTPFRPGENTLTTALTPKYDGKMVHGAEINWPGIMVLIRYENRE